MIAVVGAYLIARFQIKPALEARKSSERQEQVQRAKEHAQNPRKTYDLFKEYRSELERLGILGFDDERFEQNCKRKQNREMHAGNFMPLSEKASDILLQVVTIAIYPDTSRELRDARTGALNEWEICKRAIDAFIQELRENEPNINNLKNTRAEIEPTSHRAGEALAPLFSALRRDQIRLEKLIVQEH